MAEKSYKSIITKDWFLSDRQMEELVEKYDNKQITHEYLTGKWNMHIEYLRKHDPKKLAELQIRRFHDIQSKDLEMRRMMREEENNK